MENPPNNIKRTWCRRRDRLTAQRIDVGLVFLEMLGTNDAIAYLSQHMVPEHVAIRVLIDGCRRQRDGDCWVGGDYTEQYLIYSVNTTGV